MHIKTALVTGAAAGIGRACALRLAQDGIAVGLLDQNINDCELVAEQIRADGGKAMALQGSITDRSQVLTAVNALRSSFGPVTILVNNAGISNFIPFEELTDEIWDRMFEVNTKGAFITTQVVLPDMKAAQWGRIINISSSSAQTGSKDQVHYSASKGAVISMTRSLAQALGPYGITVNNIPPGAISNTIMWQDNQKSFNIPLDTLRQMTPVGRLGEPADIANACAWLAEDATSYVSGQSIGVNGGRIPS